MNIRECLFIYFTMKKLAIVGATGLVGQSVLEVLKEEGLINNFEIYLICSSESAGKVLVYDDRHYILNKLDDEILKKRFDYSIFVSSEEVSRKWVNAFSKQGIVIDNSSVFRLCKNVPLVVPEINFGIIKPRDRIIANPNCSTIQLVIVLDRLKELGVFDTVVVSSYQSVSGAGRDALNDLVNDSRNIFECEIKNNIIPKIGGLAENLNCSEENKIIKETKKILDQDFNICATTVRIPIPFCHGESVYVKFKNKVDLKEIKKVLDCNYIKIRDDIFYPENCVGTNYTYVCRLRQHSENEILFFVIADNLRRGASYNAVEILKRLLD